MLFPSTAALPLGTGGFLFDREDKMPGQSWHSCTCTHLHPSELSSCYRAARRPRPLPLWVLSPSGGRHADCRLLSPVSSLTFSWVSPAAFIKACFHRRPRPTPLPHSPFSPLHLHSRVSLNTISISGSCRTWRSPLSPHVIVIDLLVPLRTHPLHSLPSLQPELSSRSRWRKDTFP